MMEVLCNIIMQFGIPMDLLIKMCSNETCMSEAFHIQNGLKEEDALSPVLFNFLYSMPYEDSSEIHGIEIEWDTSAFGLR